ncbi:DUF3347 domain-containing protein [Ekhidna sp.]|uniref:DUF3347 domain-containing protein n=1 Tax=Ekhidna sp. TaxID=2608089 RepID=UPI003B5982E1
MKMKSMIYTALLSLGLMACSTGKSEKSTAQETSAVEEKVAQEASSTIDAYMELKDALVQTDATVAQSAAEKLSAAMSTEEMDATLIEAANNITSSEDVKEQRVQFKVVTDGLIASLKSNESTDGVYVQYCPMAFDNTGASWLSVSEEIRNPYFGDKMLKCGKVTEEL